MRLAVQETHKVSKFHDCKELSQIYKKMQKELIFQMYHLQATLTVMNYNLSCIKLKQECNVWSMNLKKNQKHMPARLRCTN
jgi:hypothetical protein